VGKTTAKKYVAIDCHDATLVVEVIDEKGSTELKATVSTRADAIRSLVASVKGTVEVVFEEGILAQWLHEVLRPHVSRVVVCDPRKNRRQGSKNDRIDTHALATRLRMGELSPVYHETASVQALKEMAGVYRALVQDSVRVMQRIRSVYRARAIRSRGKAAYSLTGREALLEQLSVPARTRATLLLHELEHLKPLRQQAKTLMVQQARRHSAYELLNTVPYIGPVRASLIVATMITPWRFRTKRQIWGYGGLAVVTYSTADQHVVGGKIVRRQRAPMTRGLNPNHSHVMKDVFKATAHEGARREGVWKLFYEARISQGMRPEMAELTLARKIASVVLAIWKKGVPFNPDLISPTT